MKRLDELDLAKQPSEVLDIVCKLGRGSYGSVFKARYKSTGDIVAVKKVPLDSELTDIVKEISIMQQCDSPFIVKCYGSLFDSQDLWICMEYCGAGSIADIMRLLEKPLKENEIATVLHYTLKGLDYLHQMRKIHRDIKAGNILLLNSGDVKLADFGVAGQLSDTLSKRNTVIGTPYWMAPEVIQEIGYNCSADIWSLGITAIEMADGKPPLADLHPMRALFMIPIHPPPTLSNPSNWSPEFREFVTTCLLKTSESRSSASSLLQTKFISQASPCSILLKLIDEANQAKEKSLNQLKATISSIETNGLKDSEINQQEYVDDDSAVKCEILNQVDDNNYTMIPSLDQPAGPQMDTGQALISNAGSNASFIIHDIETMKDDLNTMVYKDADSESDSGSVVVYNTEEAVERQESVLRQLDLAIQPGNEGTLTHGKDLPPANAGQLHPIPVQGQQQPPQPIQRPFVPLSRALQQGSSYLKGLANDPEAMSRLSYSQLEKLHAMLDRDMENELNNLAVRYRHKRQPLLDAIAEKSAQEGYTVAGMQKVVH